MRRKKMALALLATASIVLVTACGRKKNSDTTAAVCEQCGGERDRDGFRREHGPG